MRQKKVDTNLFFIFTTCFYIDKAIGHTQPRQPRDAEHSFPLIFFLIIFFKIQNDVVFKVKILAFIFPLTGIHEITVEITRLGRT